VQLLLELLLLLLLRLRLLKSGVCTSETRIAGSSGIHIGTAEQGSSQNPVIFSSAEGV
jgi:hypothetical protein